MDDVVESSVATEETYEEPLTETAPNEPLDDGSFSEDEIAEIRQLLTEIIVLKRYGDGEGNPAGTEAFVEACDSFFSNDAKEQIVEVVKSPAQDCPTAFRDYSFLPYGPDFGGLSGVPFISDPLEEDEEAMRASLDLAGLRVWPNGESWAIASFNDGKVNFRLVKTYGGEWRIGDVRPFIAQLGTSTGEVFTEALRECVMADPIVGGSAPHLPQDSVDMGERFEAFAFLMGETVDGGGDAVSIGPAGREGPARRAMVRNGYRDNGKIQKDHDYGELVRRGAALVHRAQFVRPLDDDPVIQVVDRCLVQADETADATPPVADTAALERIETLYK